MAGAPKRLVCGWAAPNALWAGWPKPWGCPKPGVAGLPKAEGAPNGLTAAVLVPKPKPPAAGWAPNVCLAPLNMVDKGRKKTAIIELFPNKTHFYPPGNSFTLT